MARIYVGLPVMGGFYPQMVMSLIRLMQENPGGHTYHFAPMANESLISRARNKLATDFLASDCDYFLSIDADIEFPVDAINRLVSHDKDIIAAPYTGKGSPPQWMVRFRDGEMPAYVEGVMPVHYASTGFLLVKRRVFEALKSPDLMYAMRDGSTYYAFYQPYIHQTDIPEYLSEDWAFCQRSLDKGFEIHCDFDIRLTHFGMQGFGMTEVNGKLPSNPMMPFAQSLDSMVGTVGQLASAPTAGADQEYGALLQNMLSSFQDVQDMLVNMSVGKAPESPPSP